MVKARYILLGPQRLEPTVRPALEHLTDSPGRIAIVTAGWEERESEDEELVRHLDGDVINLRLQERAEDVFHRDAELLSAMHRRFDGLSRLRDLYRLRLDHALEAARELLRMEGDDPLLEEERNAAIATVQRLDAHHMERSTAFQEAFDEDHRPAEREPLARHRKELDGILEQCSVLCIAGGHVGILLNRLRLFGLDRWVERLPVIAWSAGAMALSERIVLFHDSPPQGRVNAEVLEAGLGVLPRIVPLPHAKRRLLLDDPIRVGLFARRFGPRLCAALDEGSRIDWTEDAWVGETGTRRLCEDGTLAEVGRWS